MSANFESPIIDAHAMLGAEYHLELCPEELLRRMDAAGVEMAIVRPLGAELAVLNSDGNSKLLSAGPRLKALVSVNPWFGAKAIDELKRCQEHGAVGLFLHPSRQGFMPTDDHVRPLIEFAQAARWPVMFHTGTYIHSDIIAVGEMARRFPDVNFIAGFGGFTDMWFELPGVFKETQNLLLDASMMWGDAIEEIARDCGCERILFGSAEPRNRYASVLKLIKRLTLSAAGARAILSGNAKRIFRLQ
jgi:predicted TIM-barrel fold metal-dependent hydrolase